MLNYTYNITANITAKVNDMFVKAIAYYVT